MSHSNPISLKDVYRLWLPLAGSWLLMGIESPMLAAFVARMVSPEITLATWGSLVYPISLVVEGPIIMLLTASTALAKDMPSYKKLFKYMLTMSLILSLIHILIFQSLPCHLLSQFLFPTSIWLRNLACLLACFDRAENESSKVCQQGVRQLDRLSWDKQRIFPRPSLPSLKTPRECLVRCRDLPAVVIEIVARPPARCLHVDAVPQTVLAGVRRKAKSLSNISFFSGSRLLGLPKAA